MPRILELKETTPLVVRRDAIPDDTLAICRCGLSQSFPFCDGSHRAAKGEAGDRLYQYVREVPSGKWVRLELTRAADPAGATEVATTEASPFI